MAIGGSTVVTLAAISWATYSFFATAQVRELDRELVARVQHEASVLVHEQGVVLGGRLRIGALDATIMLTIASGLHYAWTAARRTGATGSGGRAVR